MKGGRAARGSARFPSVSSQVESSAAAPPFGIYRPAAAMWQDTAAATLSEARTQVRAFLSRKRGPESAQQFGSGDAYGTTYVEKQRMQRRNRQGLEFGGFLRSMGDFALEAAELEVPIGCLRWCGYEGTVLAGSFPRDSAAVARMLAERKHITRMLRGAGLSHVPIRLPEHVALYRYDVGRNGRNDLDDYQRKEILRIVGGELDASGVESIALDSVMVGDSYDKPFSPEEWPPPPIQTQSCVEAIA